MHEGKMDPRLRFLQDQSATERAEFMESTRMARISTARRVAHVEVLVRCRKSSGTKTHAAVEKRLKNMGFVVHAVVEGPAFVVSGSIGVDQLGDLLTEDWIELVESSHQMFPDLDLSGADVGVRPLQTVVPTVRGANVLVGLIDGGIDFTHADFRMPDGSSRLRFLWDQSTPSVPGGRVPFGREYTKADLDAALRTSPAPVPINHTDPIGHGTHVAGIAAGNGRKSNGQFMGMAPDAELVVVATRSDEGTLGESTSAVAACRYLVDRCKNWAGPLPLT